MISEIHIPGMDEYEFLNIFLPLMVATAAVYAVVAAVMYVMKAIGLYSAAKRREIRHPWLAWIPFGEFWILGSISDHYRRVCRNEVCSHRKTLLILAAVSQVIGMGAGCLGVELVETVAENAFRIGVDCDFSLLVDMGGTLALLLLAGLAGMTVSVVAVVFYCISLYDVYTSCCPKWKVLFLVFSILFPVTIPFFLFGCRKGDRGMQSAPVQPPVPLPPAEAEEEPEPETQADT